MKDKVEKIRKIDLIMKDIDFLKFESKHLMDMLLDGDYEDATEQIEQQIEENQCWIAYYKDLLKELEQGE